jgi:hypothetical protein
MQKENGKMSFGHIFPCTPVMHDIDELASRKPISTWPLRCTRTYGTHASTWATWGAHINTHQHGPPGVRTSTHINMGDLGCAHQHTSTWATWVRRYTSANRAWGVDHIQMAICRWISALPLNHTSFKHFEKMHQTCLRLNIGRNSCNFCSAKTFVKMSAMLRRVST